MAIAFDAGSVSAGLNNADTSRTWSHTIGSGSDRVLLVGTRVRDADAQNHTLATAVTYNGTPLTLYREYALLSSGLGEYLGVQWWRLVNPPTGTANIVVTWGNGVPNRGGAIGLSFSGVNQTTPLEAFGETAGAGSLTTVATVTTSTANAWVVSNAYSGATSAVLGAGPTQRDQTAYGSDFGASATTATTSAGSVTHTWTHDAAELGDYIGLAVSLVSAAITSTLTPDSTVSNTSWSAVGAATLHGALVTGDTDYITASTTGAVTELGLSNPAAPLTLTDVSFRVRARLS